MKTYAPGASLKSDFAYTCDCCEIDDGRPTLRWEPLPRRRGHFCLCYQCLTKLNYQYNIEPYLMEPPVQVNRIIIPEKLRNEIYERDGYRCVKCGNTDNLQVDHIVPFSKGGKTEKSNLQTLCKKCNVEKGNHA
jgi:hypothetical protein